MAKITSTAQLREMIENGTHDFFIQCNLGVRSSKCIDYNPETGKYHIINEVDGSKQILGEKNLFNRKYTNIGYAITQGSFFSYDY